MKTLKIDFYSDIVCPWCYIGQHRLDRILARNFQALSIDIVHQPVILMPDCPIEGLNIDDFLKTRHGAGIDRIGRLNTESQALGLDIDFRQQAFAYPTVRAHTLIRLARSLGTQHALSQAVRKAYFQDLQNIADPDVLAAIASAHGFDHDTAKYLLCDPVEQAETQQQAAEARMRGVTSVPHFVIDSVAMVSGQQEKDIVEAIQDALNGRA